MYPYVIGFFVIWFVLYRTIMFFIEQRQFIKAGMVVIEGNPERITAPPPSAYRLLFRLGAASGLILGLWFFAAIWEAMDYHQALWPIFMQPFGDPDLNSLVDVTILIGTTLGAIFICMLIWIVRAERLTGNQRATLRVILFNRGGKRQTLVFTEGEDGSWPKDFAKRLSQAGAHIAWTDDNKVIVVETPPFDGEPVIFRLDKPLGSDIVVREDDDARK